LRINAIEEVAKLEIERVFACLALSEEASPIPLAGLRDDQGRLRIARRHEPSDREIRSLLAKWCRELSLRAWVRNRKARLGQGAGGV
jgi:hypothetical protein